MEICDKAEVGHGSNKISFSNGDMKSLHYCYCMTAVVTLMHTRAHRFQGSELLGCMSEEDKGLKSKGIHWIEAITMRPPRED